MFKRLVIALFAWLITAMIAIPLLVLTGVVELEEGEDPLAVLAIGSAIFILAFLMALVVWVAVKPWIKRTGETSS